MKLNLITQSIFIKLQMPCLFSRRTLQTNHKFKRPEATVIFHKEIKLFIDDPVQFTLDLTMTWEFDTPCASKCAVPTKEVYRGYLL